MSDALTPNLGLTLPAVGASQDSWGTKLNANFSALDTKLAGNTTIAVNGWRVGADNIVENWGQINTSAGGTGTFIYGKPCTNVLTVVATVDVSTQQNYTATVYSGGSGTSCVVHTFLNGQPAAAVVRLMMWGKL